MVSETQFFDPMQPPEYWFEQKDEAYIDNLFMFFNKKDMPEQPAYLDEAWENFWKEINSDPEAEYRYNPEYSLPNWEVTIE